MHKTEAKRLLKIKTDAELAELLGISTQAVHNWGKSSEPRGGRRGRAGIVSLQAYIKLHELRPRLFPMRLAPPAVLTAKEDAK